MATKKAPKKAPAAKPAEEQQSKSGAGGELYEALLAAAGKARLAGELVAHKNGLYTRLKNDERTLAYIVRGKTVATVYPNAMAEAAPPDMTFRTVALGSHHYGRGEIVVDVKSEDDIPNAITALKASTKMPAPPKRAAVAAGAEA